MNDIHASSIRRKSEFDFIPFSDPIWEKTGHWDETWNCIIGSGEDVSIRWSGHAMEVIALVIRHPWSGIVKLTNDAEKREFIDLYSWAHHQVPIILGAFHEEKNFNAKLELVDTNPIAKDKQLVFLGGFIKTNYSGNKKDFNKIQHEQVQTWLANIQASGRDINEINKQRQAAYLQRWNETSPYMLDGSNVLDIGCGNFWPGLFEYLEGKKINYTGLDIDPNVIKWNSEKSFNANKNNFRFVHGTNDKLEFNNGEFDFVFSSHSLEHSNNLGDTFESIFRITKHGSFIFFAVPLNVDIADEHIWIMSSEHWINLVESNGFLVRNIHIGNIYPEQEYDLVIVAQKPQI
jgi:ubiquinone/menaquinone biosynthesis C-methylase UbiE